MNNNIVKEKILSESTYEKYVQTTIEGDNSTLQYTQRYYKEFCNKYKDGWRWVAE